MKTIPTFSHANGVHLFLDVDGVFADFDGRVKNITGKWPWEMKKSEMWKAIDRDASFFFDLELMDGADSLWEYAKQYNPTFLTGSPSSKEASDHKKRWILEKEHTLPSGSMFKFAGAGDIIVLPRRDKKLYAGGGRVLVDDRDDNLSQWIENGGTGVLHTDAWSTIEKLEDLRTRAARVG